MQIQAFRPARLALPFVVAVLAACQATGPVPQPSDVRQLPGLYDSKVDKNLSFNAPSRPRPTRATSMHRTRSAPPTAPSSPTRPCPTTASAAAQGLAVAQCNLGYMHLTGQATPRDLPQAVHWLGLCAQQGHFMGQFALGQLYLNGMAYLRTRGGPSSGGCCRPLKVTSTRSARCACSTDKAPKALRRTPSRSRCGPSASTRV